MTNYKEKIDSCLQLKKEILDRGVAIMQLGRRIAPNGFKTHYDPEDYYAKEGRFYEEFEILPWSDKIRFQMHNYYRTALGLYEDIIPIEWLDMQDRDLAAMFLDKEVEYSKKLQKQNEEEKEKRYQQYLKLKEEFENEDNN